jgi:hypothetical protein
VYPFNEITTPQGTHGVKPYGSGSNCTGLYLTGAPAGSYQGYYLSGGQWQPCIGSYVAFSGTTVNVCPRVLQPGTTVGVRALGNPDPYASITVAL